VAFADSLSRLLAHAGRHIDGGGNGASDISFLGLIQRRVLKSFW